MKPSTKIRVLFVGSFLSKTKTGGLGGQMFASKTLIESDLSDQIHWIKIDTTAINNIKTAFYVRALRAFFRLVKFTFHILFSRVDKVLIFTGSGSSFKEKGTMALIAVSFRKEVVLAPRSGSIQDDFNSSRKQFIAKVFTKVNIVICQGNSWKNIFMSQFPDIPSHRFKVVANALDTSKYIHLQHHHSEIPHIVLIAWIDRNKGVYELVEAAQKLKEKGFRFKLSMCGHGRDYDAIVMLVKQKKLDDCVFLPGWIYEEEKNKTLSSADIFVLPTYFEGMPNALMEAMACGIAAIASSVGAIPDMISHNENGVLIPAKNVSELTLAIEDLLVNKDKRERLGKAAKEFILKEHTVEVMVNKYREIFFPKRGNHEKILIDFSPLKSGGGVQLAYNFLDSLARVTNAKFMLLVPKNHFKSYREHSSISKVYEAPTGVIKRLYFEYFTLKKIFLTEHCDTVFTFFGAGLPHPKNVKSVVGVAYPSICYKDSLFWDNLPWSKKWKTHLINIFRIHRLKKADIIFVETEIMKQRVAAVLNKKESEFQIIPPSPTNYVQPLHKRERTKNVLLLSSNSPQKNLWRLYEIILQLKQKKYQLKFIVSVSKEEWLSLLPNSVIDEGLVSQYIDFIGTVYQKEIQDLYVKSDVLLMLSDLESFSNNHMEAWKTGIPQIVSDRDFCRNICKDSALYVDPHNAVDVVEKLILLLEDTSLQKTLVDRGNQYLKTLPSPDERTRMILELINE